jgi:hypothetical protein
MVLLRQVADLMDATIHIDSENDEQGSPVMPARSQIEAAIQQALLAAQLPLPEQVTLHYLGGSVEARLQYLLPSAGALDSLHQQEWSIHRALDGGIPGVVRIGVLWRHGDSGDRMRFAS